MTTNKQLDRELDDVIKNPTRQTPPVRAKYEPEYIRLNKDPVQQEETEVPHTSVPLDPIQGKTFVSVDGLPLDDNDVPIDINGHIIDNNDYVNFGGHALPSRESHPEHSHTTSPEIGDYILMVLGKLITSGPLEKIEMRVKAIIYGEDSAFKGLEVGLDDIVVLKRVALKIGVFIDD